MLRIEFDPRPATERLRTIRSERLPDWRRRLADQIGRDVLHETVAGNPVDTGRSRSAWVSALEQLGGEPPADWQGPHPDPEAVAEGAQQSRLAVSEARHETDLRAASGVRYVRYLEYGTRRMRPFAMIRKALAQVRDFLSRPLPSLFGNGPQ